jgi:hypothetical protein
MYLLLFLIPLLLILEAVYEAKNGDKHHWPSLTASIVISAVFIYFLVPEQSIHLWLSWFWYYCCIRSMFDFMYNHFRGMPFHYLGNTAKTDILLRKIRAKMSKQLFTLLRLAVTALLFIFFLGQLHRYYETTHNLTRFRGAFNHIHFRRNEPSWSLLLFFQISKKRRVMFLQVDSTLVEKGLEISPYSTAVYGFLVAVLAFAAFKFYKDYKQEIEHNRASTKE